MTYQKSYLKWAGGKFRVLPQIDKLLDVFVKYSTEKVWIEPFCGSGVVALNFGHLFKHVVLNDANRMLINCHKTVTHFPGNVVDKAKRQFDYMSKEEDLRGERYNTLRDIMNDCQTLDEIDQAVNFITINRFGFNGLWRTNKEGKCNVPIGSTKHPEVPEVEVFNFADKLRHAKWTCFGFDTFFNRLNWGVSFDKLVFYVDPPYAPITSGHKYTADGFTINDHQHLIQCCREAARKGAIVIYSNHDLPVVREMLGNVHHIESFPVRRSISCKGDDRKPAQELLVVF